MQNKRRRAIIVGGVLAALATCGLALVITAARGAPGSAAAAPPPATSEAPQMVRAQEVRSATEATEQTFTGVVRARYEIDLAFRIGSKIVSRHVEVGQAVRAGTLLFRADASDYRLAVKAAQADLAAAEAEVAQTSAEDFRFSRLQGAASYSELDKTRSAKEIAAGRRDRAREGLTLAVNRHSYCELVADADGVITALPAEAGQVVAEGQVVAKLARDGEREAVVSLPENQALSSRVAPATVTLWSAPGETFPATLRELSPSADPVTRTYQARFTIQNPNPKVVLGMTATVHLRPAGAAVGYVLPLTSLYRRGDQPAVWGVDRATGRLNLHPVTVREFRHDTVVLASGVAPGLWVVTAGVQKLDPSLTVQIWENRQ